MKIKPMAVNPNPIFAPTLKFFNQPNIFNLCQFQPIKFNIKEFEPPIGSPLIPDITGLVIGACKEGKTYLINPVYV